jgi:hypothetical protein
LVYSDTVQDRGEFMTVLSSIDLLWIGPKNFDAAVLEPKSDVLRKLTCLNKSTIL